MNLVDGVRIGACLPYAHREMLDPRMVLVSATVVAVAALALTVFGPVGIDDNLGPLQRFAFVVTCSILCWPLCHALSAATLSLVRTWPPRQIMLACAGAVLFSTLPCTAVTCMVYWLFEPTIAAQVGVVEIYCNVAVAVGMCSLLVHYAACVRVRLRHASEAAGGGRTGLMATATEPTGDGRAGPTETAAEASSHDCTLDVVPTPGGAPSAHGLADPSTGSAAHRRAASAAAAERQARFLDRLPEPGSRDVVYLHVNGHYVNVVTTAGSHMILMRFADAVAELGDLGLQVHRSYWVALRHVTGALRRDERTVLRVTGDREVPVSRTYLAAVRAAIAVPSRQHNSPLPARPASG